MTGTGGMTPLDQQVAGMVGRVDMAGSGTVHRREFQRWAAAVGDHNPLYFDLDYARAHGHRDVVMPPMFISRIVNDIDRIEDLRPDGIPVSRIIKMPPFERFMFAGDETEFYRCLHPGDVVTCERVVAAITRKAGRSGEFSLVTREIVYRAEDGGEVARTRSSTIAR